MEPPGAGLRQHVAAIIRDAAPFALCPACVASKSNIAEKDVRRATQALVVLLPEEFAVVERVCSGCHTATKLVALRNT